MRVQHATAKASLQYQIVQQQVQGSRHKRKTYQSSAEQPVSSAMLKAVSQNYHRTTFMHTTSFAQKACGLYLLFEWYVWSRLSSGKPNHKPSQVKTVM